MTAKELRAWRRKMRLTQPELAAKFGVSASIVSNWERERYPVPLWVPLALAALWAERAAPGLLEVISRTNSQ